MATVVGSETWQRGCLFTEFWLSEKNAEFLEVHRFFDREICDLSDFF